MNEKLKDAIAKQTTTEYAQWRNVLTTLALTVLVTSTVATWGYIFYSTPNIECHENFWYLSLPWLLVQWVVIGFMFWYRNIPMFARHAIQLLIMFSNVWFIFFIFSLRPCGV
ncbi:hypothetical protein GCM10007392_47990 [Saccharospirillum salsuginis]|uniref:Uncharacterized protein n=1 Tax=Saccharospirillum salsuginis TaxID=418750 RepID=A0A918NJH2_9GAMM|nr:hypothetical protein GCM10007392_47990 [Saccharospirillum salsuginis]